MSEEDPGRELKLTVRVVEREAPPIRLRVAWGSAALPNGGKIEATQAATGTAIILLLYPPPGSGEPTREIYITMDDLVMGAVEIWGPEKLGGPRGSAEEGGGR